MSLIADIQRKLNGIGNPIQAATGWPTWESEGAAVLRAEVDASQDKNYMAAVAARDAIYHELVALRMEWDALAAVERQSLIPLPENDARALEVLARINEIGPQLGQAITDMHRAFGAAIPSLYAYHAGNVAPSYARWQELKAIADQAEAEAFAAKATHLGHANGEAWCRNNAARFGAKLPAQAKPDPLPSPVPLGTVNVNTPGVAVPTDATTRPVR